MIIKAALFCVWVICVISLKTNQTDFHIKEVESREYPYVAVEETISEVTEMAVLPVEGSPKDTYTQVDESFLEDALFIGDSRTALLYEYADWKEPDYFVQYGMTIWDVLDTTIITCDEFSQMTVRDALNSTQYGKIYIMLGINELGNEDAQGFYNQYVDVLKEIRACQPEAVIFVQAILHVADYIDQKMYYINNTEINIRNDVLKNIVEEPELGNIYYMDFNYLYDDENGKLTEEYTYDGIHVKPKYMEWWQEYLLEHGVEREV